MLCLVVGVAFFTSCKTDGDDDEGISLVGTWADETAGDSFIITGTTLTYRDYTGTIGYYGTIKETSTFTDDAGVIIMEYASDGKQQYYDYGPAPDYAPTNPHYGPGTFLGIYYEDLKAGSVKLAGAFVANGAEAANLDTAKAKFTVGKKGEFVFQFGVYTKQ
jgi:hypothetical protein